MAQYDPQNADKAIEDADRTAIQMRADAVRWRDRVLGGDVPSTFILSDVYATMRNYRREFDRIAAVPNIVARATEVKGNPNIAEDFNDMRSAIDGVTANINTTFPKDGGGFLLASTLGADGPVDRQFTPAQTAGLAAALQGVVDSVVG